MTEMILWWSFSKLVSDDGKQPSINMAARQKKGRKGGWILKLLKKSSCLELLSQLDSNLSRMVTRWCLPELYLMRPHLPTKMAVSAKLSLTWEIHKKIFLYKTSVYIRLYLNLMVLMCILQLFARWVITGSWEILVTLTCDQLFMHD